MDTIEWQKKKDYKIIQDLCDHIQKSNQIYFYDNIRTVLREACERCWINYGNVPNCILDTEKELNQKIGIEYQGKFLYLKEITEKDLENLPVEIVGFFLSQQYPIKIIADYRIELSSSFLTTNLSSIGYLCNQFDFMIIPIEFFKTIYIEKFKKHHFFQESRKRFQKFLSLTKEENKELENYIICPFSESFLYELVFTYQLDVNSIYLPQKYAYIKHVIHSAKQLNKKYEELESTIKILYSILNDNFQFIEKELNSIKFNIPSYAKEYSEELLESKRILIKDYEDKLRNILFERAQNKDYYIYTVEKDTLVSSRVNTSKESLEEENSSLTATFKDELESILEQLENSKKLASSEVVNLQKLNQSTKNNLFSSIELKKNAMQYLVISIHKNNSRALNDKIIHIGPCFDEEFLNDDIELHLKKK